MIKNWKWMLVGILMIIFAVMLPAEGNKEAGSGDAKPYTMTVGFQVSDKNDHAETWKYFAETLEKKTNGRIKVNLVFNGALGTDTEILKKVQINAVQGGLGSISNTLNTITELKPFEMPYSLEVVDDYKMFFNDDLTKIGGPIGERVQQGANAKGVQILWVTTVSFRQMATRDTIMHKPADIAGLKIRTSASPVERAIVSALGANPITMGFSETYTGLQQKVVDGLTVPEQFIYSGKMSEVTKAVTMANLQPLASICYMSKEFYDDLPADLQQAVDESAAEAVSKMLDFTKQYEQITFDGLASHNVEVYYPTPAEIEGYKQALQTVNDEFGAELDPEMLGLIEEWKAANR